MKCNESCVMSHELMTNSRLTRLYHTVYIAYLCCVLRVGLHTVTRIQGSVYCIIHSNQYINIGNIHTYSIILYTCIIYWEYTVACVHIPWYKYISKVSNQYMYKYNCLHGLRAYLTPYFTPQISPSPQSRCSQSLTASNSLWAISQPVMLWSSQKSWWSSCWLRCQSRASRILFYLFLSISYLYPIYV